MNNRGFTTLSFIAALPFIFCLVFSTLWILWFLMQKNRMENLCSEHVLHAQEELVSANNKVMALNPKALALILEKRALTALITVSPPHLRPPLYLKRKAVIVQQKLLRSQQRMLLSIGNHKSRGKLFELRHSFYKRNKGLREIWNNVNGTGQETISIFWNKSQLKIKVRDTAPVYKRTPNHSRAQSFQVRWNVPLRNIIPTWLKELAPIHRQWSGQCDSHPLKGGYQWYAQIGKVNRLLKPYF